MDEYERERLDMNHEKYRKMYAGKLMLSPLQIDNHKILDIGCGTGV
jgi:2-polyprenyl-3-methyl-5-hydroxy-6-metoxy-1,4-benzoquinol methylase